MQILLLLFLLQMNLLYNTIVELSWSFTGIRTRNLVPTSQRRWLLDNAADKHLKKYLV